jgi:BirA family biotin operon repressor/biotin-[acetyl-CoA-carboxylase] ligase
MTTGAWTKIIELDEVSSTNQYLYDLTVCQDVIHGTVVSAAYQSAGKGYGDASWESEAGRNILASIYLKEPCIPVEKQFYLSKVTSLAIRDILKAFCKETRIKWPNDILVRDHKIAGILIETIIEGKDLKSAVIGIGLNVNQEHFSPHIPAPTSLMLETGQGADVKRLLQVLINCLRDRYEQLCRGEFNTIDLEYLANLYRYGEQTVFRESGHQFKATITGVRESGELELKVLSGGVRTYAFKEIQYGP